MLAACATGRQIEGGRVLPAAVSRARLRDMYKRLGDLGEVAQACRSKQVQLVPTVAGARQFAHNPRSEELAW